MEQTKYRVIFKGELQEGHTKEMALRALAGAYHKEDDYFEPWFAKETIIKKEATQEEADYIKEYLASLGLTTYIEPISNIDAAIDERNVEHLLEEAVRELQKSFRNAQGETVQTKIIQIQPAPMMKRAMAFVIDLIICLIISKLILEIVLAPLGLIDTATIQEFAVAVNNAATQEALHNVINSYIADPGFANLVMQVMFFSFSIQALYFGLMDSKYGATLGKKLFRIKVYSLISPQLYLRQAILRQVYIIVSFFVLVSFFQIVGLLVLIGIFIMGRFDKRKMNQTFFDRVTATVVGIDQTKK